MSNRLLLERKPCLLMLFWLFPPPKTLSHYPENCIHIFLCILQNFFLFSSSVHDAEVYTEEARESTGILYFIYDYIFFSGVLRERH